MAFYDVCFTLDAQGIFQSAVWGREAAKQMYHLQFEDWIARNCRAQEMLPLPRGQEDGNFSWNKDIFSFQYLPAPDGKRYLFISQVNEQNLLFMRALDYYPGGVQIYDKDANALYFNKASREISHIPPDTQIKGRHLLDLYNLDENISTTMTALRTKSPVIKRVDHFQTSDGVSIATSNTSYPIIRKGRLMGAVVFEQTEELIEKEMKDLEDTRRALRSFSAQANRTSFSGYTFHNVIGSGRKLRDAVALAERVAPQDSSVLLVGETGTGKEIFAQSIYRASTRNGKRFLAINCAAIPDTLIESLLFGTQKGSFTGSEDRVGYFEEANGGTIFLDELNSMSMSMQSKLLRVLQEKTFRRIGGSKDLKLDVRIISSCNEDPFQAISENKFRRDLFYRLSTVAIELPPLREHLEDLEELVQFHLDATNYQYVHSITQVDPQVFQILRAYQWPGNVRELFHVVDYAQNVADSAVMKAEHLPSYLLRNRRTSGGKPQGEGAIDFSTASLQQLLDEREKEVISQALEHYGYNISRTAQALGILRQSLQYRIRKYGLVF